MTAARTMIALLLFAAAMSAQAQILRCVDKSGKVIGFANECPPGTQAQQTGIKSAPSAPPAAKPAPTVAEQQAEFRKRQMEQQEAEKKAAEKLAENKERERACEQSRAVLKGFQSGQRITRIDPKTGERLFLDDKEYAAEMASAQRAVDANCK